MIMVDRLFHSPHTLNVHVKKGNGSLIRLPGETTAKWSQIGAALMFLSHTPSLLVCTQFYMLSGLPPPLFVCNISNGNV